MVSLVGGTDQVGYMVYCCFRHRIGLPGQSEHACARTHARSHVYTEDNCIFGYAHAQIRTQVVVIARLI